jgi:outer membrane receptor protein involved in Fe transport
MYANLISQGIIRNTNNKYKAGASYMWDVFDEVALGRLYNRDERVVGVFGEYTYTPTELITIVGGLRVDYHNNFGLFATPRLHARYAFNENTTARASFGSARRTASIFAENLSSFTSNRAFFVMGTNANTPYGLDQEVAWNYGFNITHQTKIDYRPAMFSLDFYRTDFVNQIIVDRETAGEVYFFNLDGNSVSHSIQAQVDYSPIRRLDLRLAYRWFDARADYREGMLQVPMISPHRWFLNAAYATKNKWSFDATIQWMSSKRLPSTAANPVEYQMEDFSPSFFLVNGQVSKLLGKKWDLYLGVENLLNFRQNQAIIAADDPFNEAFDAGLVWGPIFGRNFYLGFRYRIANEEEK